MSKTITNTLVCLLFSLRLFAQEKPATASNFLVHITAFNEKRPLNYFDNLTNVVMKQDNKGIWHYYLGTYKTLEEADSVRRTVLSKGYPYTYVIDVEKVRRECKLECDKDPSLDPSLPSIMQRIRNTSHLLFDFGKNQLRPEAKTQLNRLSQILAENSKLRVEFKGHTDNIGSAEFNLALSEKRADAASSYLKTRSVATDRIKLSSYGKDAPIAKNQKAGKDCPQGRRFNRRVEIFITDMEGNVLNALVEPLDIPTELLAEETAKVKM